MPEELAHAQWTSTLIVASNVIANSRLYAPMQIRPALTLAALVLLPPGLVAQSGPSSPIQVYGGFNYLSNSFNGLPGEHHGLTGWDAGTTLPWHHHLRAVIDFSRVTGTNQGSQQQGTFYMGGGQYEVHFHREGLFVKGLAGVVGLNRYWGPGGTLSGTASFTEFLGGGLDTPLTHGFALRAEGGWQHTNLALIQSLKDPVPYHLAGLPQNFGRISAGVVWTARSHGYDSGIERQSSGSQHEPVASELIIEGLNSFGHYHIFADTWWSYLSVGGVEYDRHSWGKAIGAQLDYVAEVLPVVILRQPAKTDVFGDRRGNEKIINPGLGITPIGLRMMWRAGREWKPYYEIKGGMIGFTHKALSNYASYENFSLQQSIGMQLKLTSRWDFRCGFSDFHFSNGFVVPNNPGIDEMAYNGGLSYHFGRPPGSQ
jgi:hypothetical protein